MIRVAVAFSLLLASPVWADDRDYLTAFLEDNLSGAGRQVVVTGFKGALSSKASIEQLTIADADGVWITLKDVVLDWNRSALLGGRVVVNQLTAGEIVLDRMPVADEGSLPTPEAGGFSLPELPVSVEISRVAAERIALGETVLGQAVEGRLEAALSLVGGEGSGQLELTRTDDGPEGVIDLSVGYSNARAMLDLDLSAREEAGGLAVTLLGLPGAPEAELSIKGEGAISDFLADVSLVTDGVDRLTGSIALQQGDDGAQGFSADLRGDLAPLFLPEYADFFGSDMAVLASGRHMASGGVSLDQLSVETRALRLEGGLALGVDGLPEAFDLRARLGMADGSPVLLPLSGTPTRVTAARIDLAYDRAKGDGWRGAAVIEGLDREDVAAERLSLAGSGRIGREDGLARFGATVTFDAAGLVPADPDMARALGREVTGKAVLFWSEGVDAVQVPRISVNGPGVAISGGGEVAGLEEALRLTGRIRAEAEDLSRFAGLAGRALGGQGVVEIEGNGSTLAGDFDLTGVIEGRDLRIGQAEVDNLLRGQSRLQLSARRDATGTTLREARVTAAGLSGLAAGKLATAGSDLTAEFTLNDLSVLGAGFSGAMSGSAEFKGTLAAGVVRLDGTGRQLRVGQAEADKLLAGTSTLSARLNLRNGKVQIDRARLGNPQISAEATGEIAGALRKIAVKAQLANLGLLLPEFPGAATLSGTVTQDSTGYSVGLRGRGPGQIDATVTGKLAAGFGRADLSLSGTGQAGLANAFIEPRSVSGPIRFDLALNGPITLSSVSGRVTLSGGRVSDVELGMALERTNAVIDLRQGRANVSATTEVSTGGRLRVDGGIGLTAPFAADLSVQIDGVRLRDASLYDTTASGGVTVTGPLAGGARIAGSVTLGVTELLIPSTGFGGAGGLPGLTHRNEPEAVRATRVRAGLLGEIDTGRTSSDPANFALDIQVKAPNRVFIRGRGLDAELGGQLSLGGTTASIIPGGGFELIRGRLDILGKRLVLSEATIQLEGDFIPYVAIAAANESDGYTSFVRIDGPAKDPIVSFSSSPELPQEEVLSHLLFGRGLDTISPLQAAQLANAVASLAGKGGEGVIGRLRKGFGLDDLDVSTAADGTTSLRAGKYLSENIYSELEVDQNGKSQINLNLDIRQGLTVKGRVSADGTTGIGVYVEKDY